MKHGKLIKLVLFAGLMALFAACTPSPRKVVEQRFPECFAPPRIGARSGARCKYDQAKQEWHITFWHGWGDCPAGCIYHEDSAWYLVDKKGRVFVTDKNFQPLKEAPRGDKINPGAKKGSRGQEH